MARAAIFALLFAGFVNAQIPKLPPPPPIEYPDPPEEDESLAIPREYAFNPLQAKKEIDTGNFYWKKGNHKAAAARYREATQWDNSNPEAFLKLGEAHEKLKEFDEARAAYEEFAKLTTDSGKLSDIRKRIAKFPKAASAKPLESKSIASSNDR